MNPRDWPTSWVGRAGDANSIVLLTEYKNVNAFVGREALFASILRDLPSATPGLVSLRPEELYETVETPANPDTAQFKLILHSGMG